MGFFVDIGKGVADKLTPLVEEKGQQLLTYAEAKGEELLDKVMDKIGEEFEKRFPALAAALIAAVTHAMGEMAVNSVDKVTDMIPGQLDDQIVDPAIKQGMTVFQETLKRFGIG